ncbi:MAG: hypothetical protein A2289_08350 [Deltaproteobacteria bacterium RIFOXYA12_FULL_58_15]|nr:MAG: hypothetical protein A2289_08350 [Deltaproteobacteria bacterium RIFOXYA12_FULL_58_15]OGR14059.1 MAG: hypothetical protein A2341_19155 [Deltaproteobacteria bacterium RIFOXYB12_FULL_58_9]
MTVIRRQSMWFPMVFRGFPVSHRFVQMGLIRTGVGLLVSGQRQIGGFAELIRCRHGCVGNASFNLCQSSKVLTSKIWEAPKPVRGMRRPIPFGTEMRRWAPLVPAAHRKPKWGRPEQRKRTGAG